MDAKNYRINLMDGEHVYVTALQAAQLLTSLSSAKFVLIDGDIYAVHQVKSIKRLSQEEEITKFKQIQKGIDDYLTGNMLINTTQ